MSSWYVWAELGVYPQTPGVPMLVLGTPQFPRAVIHGAYGDLTISASGAGDTYVQRLTADGRPSGHTWVDLSRTHELDFTLSATPDTSWGSAASDAPPSFGAGPVQFPPSTRASLQVSPGQVRLSPGTSTTVTVDADNTLGTSGPATVTWQATAPSGLSATPASGTITAPAGGTAQTTVTIAATGGMTTGYYQVAFASQASNGAIIPAVSLLLTVAQPGESIPTAYVSNYSANTVTPVDTRTHTAGPPIPVGAGPDGMIVTGKDMFIANNNSNDVTVIDTTTNAVIKTIPVGSIAADGAAPFGVAVTPDSSKVFVTNGGSSSVSVIAAATDNVTATIPTGAGPQYVQLTPDGTTAYVADFGAGGVTPIAVATGTPGTFIPTGSGAYAVGFSPDGATAWVVDTNVNNVVPVTVATGTPGAAVEVGNVPDGVTVTG